MSDRTGQKHLVKCRCVLPQYKAAPDPPIHQFVVFSVVDADGEIVPRVAKCNNCGILHRVRELCKSEILTGREDAVACATIDDIRDQLHPRLGALLDREGADLASWEAVKFCVDEERWGDIVVVTSERVDTTRQGKYVRVLGPALFKIETFVRDEVATQEARWTR